jgi:hypothetical protein
MRANIQENPKISKQPLYVGMMTGRLILGFFILKFDY